MDRVEVRAYRVQGTVQRVGFRWWTQRTACAMGVQGTVRNAEDGAVEILAQGGVSVLDRFEAALWKGPVGARVDGVARSAAEVRGPLEGFMIVR